MTALFSLFLNALLAGLLVLIAAFTHFDYGLPDHKQLAHYEPAIVTQLYTSDGKILQEYAIEKRIFVPCQAIPLYVRHCFIAAEDKNFYHHIGIDVYGLVRAALTNLMHFNHNRRPIGASTITQQVARNFLLSDELSLQRKIKEALLAIRIDATFDKNHILELYLNEIYLGFGAYGVAAAAQVYFNKSLDELTLAEAAFLAALPKAPNNYNPHKYAKRALARRNWVLQRLWEDGYITPAEAQAAMAEPLKIHPGAETPRTEAPYFAEEVRRFIMNHYGESALYEGGLVVHTALDTYLQGVAERVFRQGLQLYDKRHGWRGPLANVDASLLTPTRSSPTPWGAILSSIPRPIGAQQWQRAVILRCDKSFATIGLESGEKGKIFLTTLSWARQYINANQRGPVIQHTRDVFKVGDIILVSKTETPEAYELCQIPQVRGAMLVLNPHNGRILAMVGGWSYEESEFNRATQAQRQPGSLFKPFVYLAGLEQGLRPNTIIDDAPIAIDLGYNLGYWRPNNITKRFYGPCPLRIGLEQSRNAMTVRLAQLIGLPPIADVAERLGVVDKLPPYMAMVLGAGETTLIRLAQAYASFFNGGKRIQASLVDKIQDRTGRTIYRHDQRAFLPVDVNHLEAFPTLIDNRPQVIDPIKAYQILSMMEGAVQRGTARALGMINKPIAAKTGTSSACQDAWCVGGTPDLLVAVYLGFDTPETLGERETGGRAAAPIVATYLTEILHSTPPVPFRLPAGISLVSIHSATGKRVSPSDPGAITEVFSQDQLESIDSSAAEAATSPPPPGLY